MPIYFVIRIHWQQPYPKNSVLRPSGTASKPNLLRQHPTRRTGRSRLDDFGRAVSRILSSRRSEEHRGENHLSQQPVPGTRSAVAEHGAGSSGVPYLALHLMGFSVPRRFRARAVGSYSTFSPLLRRLLSDAAG